MTPALAFRILTAAGFLAAWPGLSGQTASPPRAFEVASVKLNTSVHDGIGNKFGPDSMRWTNTPLRVLIEAICRLKNYQVLGGPAWIDSDRWDIDAKAAAPASNTEKLEMMGTLLADRFQLRFHRETRQLPVYRLVVAKGGSTLAQAKEQDANHRWGTTPGPGSLLMTGASMQEFAWWLSSELNQPIVESTGLTGRYDLTLEWAQDDSQTPGADASPDAAKLPIFGAVEYQLGLKLESTKGPVEVLVIDHVERASGN
jgi:uncharacterized protein (TIGR03435 family)